MNRSEAEQQAKCWAWWTGEETRAHGTREGAWWDACSPNGYWREIGSLIDLSSSFLRRAIEAKGATFKLAFRPQFAPDAGWHALIELGSGIHASVAPTLEQALYAAALAAASTDAAPADTGAGAK